ncbi:hypothetical protein LINPERPRIM_LOCUS31529 [Linum perenne]
MPLFDPPRHDSAETIRRALKSLCQCQDDYMRSASNWKGNRAPFGNANQHVPLICIAGVFPGH